MMAMSFTVVNGSFIPGRPVELFRQPVLGAGTTVRATYDVSRDGRFLFNQAVPEANAERVRKIFPSSLRFILNWADEVGRQVSGSK